MKIKLSKCETITDVKRFIKGHKEIIEGGTEKWRDIYKERLEKVKRLMKEQLLK